MRFIYIVFIGGLLGLTSCNNGSSVTNTGKSDTTIHSMGAKVPAHSKLSDAGTQMLMAVVNKYYDLKNAMVTAKAAKADSAATQLAIAADSLQAYIIKDSANTALKPFADTIIAESKLVTTITDESCERQRIVFDVVSRAMYELLKSVELKNAGIYHEYCPMAFNERGAYWLSDDADIKNPYFGKKMLECGEVTDSL